MNQNNSQTAAQDAAVWLLFGRSRKMFNELFGLMGMMFCLIVIGFLLRRAGKITDGGKSTLVDMILYVILPCNIIKAFSIEMDPGFWRKFIQLLLCAAGVQVLAMLAAHFCYRRMTKGERQAFQYGTVCSNSGFMGNPLAEGVFGDVGLVYAAVFLIPQRIVMWTAGVSYFSKEEDKRQVYKKIAAHPCMVATYIGLLILIFQIQLPLVAEKTVYSLSNCCTAMTMMYIGTILVDVKPAALIDPHQIYFAFLRLIGIPLTVFLLSRPAGADPLVAAVCTLLSGTPAGSTTSILAAKYHGDEPSAAKCVVLTTALSVATIPLWSMFLLSGL